jgi:hypothetical protein
VLKGPMTTLSMSLDVHLLKSGIAAYGIIIGAGGIVAGCAMDRLPVLLADIDNSSRNAPPKQVSKQAASLRLFLLPLQAFCLQLHTR